LIAVEFLLTVFISFLLLPTKVVLGCSSAGALVSFFTAPMADPSVVPSSAPPRAQTEPTILREQASEWVSDTVVLCPCSKGEWLPMNTDYPVDIFTSSLTTPLKIVLQWSIQRNPVSMASLHPDAETTFLVFSTIEKLHLEN
jgi:hypothetical protein